MKRIFLAVTMIALASPALADTFKNEPSGFRHIEWSTSFAKVRSKFTLAEKGKESNYYTRKGDKLSIGDATLKAIYYRFYRNKFSGVLLITEGIGNKNEIIRAFKAQFGPGKKPNPLIDQYFWFGDKSRIGIICNSVTNGCKITLQSMAMNSMEEADHKKAAAKAKGDF